ncbi:MAG: hypothetical protein Ct9H300mP28_35610 [Pseudomonadota bacterium]|nr:MAG: hypothetical protein Ct9H300mP28_35610 [Pseudomonadota bacterium]
MGPSAVSPEDYEDARRFYITALDKKPGTKIYAQGVGVPVVILLKLENWLNKLKEKNIEGKKFLKNFMFNQKHLFLNRQCIPTDELCLATLSVRSPAEISTREIRKLLLVHLRWAQLAIKFKTEKNGPGETHPVLLMKSSKKLSAAQ